MSSVFRFEEPTLVAPSSYSKLLRKRKLRRENPVTLLASDSSSITNGEGTCPIHLYRDMPRLNYVTLTRKESDLIALANPGFKPPVALEDAHAWLPRLTFVEDSRKNFKALTYIMQRYGEKLFSSASFCDQKWNTICNAVRIKTDADARFYTAWHLPIQDVFLLEENRASRAVIAIDFNAMYPACMQQGFPKPGAMRHVLYGRDLEDGERLPVGLYRCVLQEAASDFIIKHNPFRSFFAGRHFRAALTEPVKIDLNEFEIQFFQRHFGRISLIDAVVSDASISHPLAREARRSFARRKNYLRLGNKPLADREKFLSALLSSCSHRPNRWRHNFSSWKRARKHLRAYYGINPRSDEPSGASEAWLRGRKGITVLDTEKGIRVDAPDLRDGGACFLFNQRTVARGRIVLLEMMETILSLAPEVEICYVNIDSIHFSLPSSHFASALGYLQSRASGEMGSFKIESISSHGLWLEPGRYWLYGDAVNKFRNRGVGNRKLPFADHAIYVGSKKIGDFYVPVRATIRMDRSMSDMREIVEDPVSGVDRQLLVEIGDESSFAEVIGRLAENRRLWVPRRLEVYKNLESSIRGTLSRCLGTRL